MTQTVLAAVISLIMVSPLAAQIKASGDAIKEVQQFNSPMRLEVPLDPREPVWTTRELKSYVCDESFIESLRVWRHKRRADQTWFEVEISALVATRPGEDRKASLKMEMLNDELQMVFHRKGKNRYQAKASEGPEPGWSTVFAIAPFEAEESKKTERTVKFRVDKDALRAVLDGPNPRLVILMTVTPDP